MNFHSSLGLIIIVIVLVFSFSCSTTANYTPDSELSTLLIIKIKSEIYSDKSMYTTLNFNNGRRKIRIGNDQNYVFIKNLRSGKNIFSIRDMVFTSPLTGDVVDRYSFVQLNVQFTLMGEHYTILPYKIMIKEEIKTGSGGYDISRSLTLDELTAAEINNIQADLLSYDFMHLWKNHETTATIIENTELVDAVMDITEEEEANTDLLPLVTVLDFTIENLSKAEGMIIVDLLSNYLFETNRFRVLDRGQRDNILLEINFSLSGCADELCQLEVGKMLAADKIVVGSLGRIGNRYIINTKLIEVPTGETVSTSQEIYRSIDDLIDNCQNIIEELSDY